MRAPMAGERILWVRYNSFGDVLQTIAGVRIFKEKFPDTHIALLTRALYKPFVVSQHCFDEVITGDRTPLMRYINTVFDIRKLQHFDWFINDQGSGKTDTLGVLCKIPNKVYYEKINIFRRPLYDYNIWDWLQEIDVDIRNRETQSIFATKDSIQAAEPFLQGLPEKKVFAIIGGSWKQKMWLTEYWCIFIKQLVNDGWGVVLNGHGNNELQVANEIQMHVPSQNVRNLVNKLDFVTMLGASSLCTIAVGNDTGPLHLAALQHIPTIGIFGGTSYARTDLLMPNFRPVLTTCPFVGCERTQTCSANKCFASVTPDRVRTVFDQMTRGL